MHPLIGMLLFSFTWCQIRSLQCTREGFDILFQVLLVGSAAYDVHKDQQQSRGSFKTPYVSNSQCLVNYWSYGAGIEVSWASESVNVGRPMAWWPGLLLWWVSPWIQCQWIRMPVWGTFEHHLSIVGPIFVVLSPNHCTVYGIDTICKIVYLMLYCYWDIAITWRLWLI